MTSPSVLKEIVEKKRLSLNCGHKHKINSFEYSVVARRATLGFPTKERATWADG